MSESAFANKITILAREYNLVAIYAFGSRAMDAFAKVNGERVESGPIDSDLDVGVLPDEDTYLSVEDKVQLGFAFEKLFEVPKVDVVVIPEAPPFLALEIVRGELLFTADPEREANYQLYVLSRAGDLAAWERERRKMLLDGEAI